MSEYLTPTEVDAVAERNAPIWPQYTATLRAMAEIVEAVARVEVFDLDDTCVFCQQYLGAEYPEYMHGGHAPDCICLKARKVRGYE